jgi:hypothetical protein
MDSRCHGLQPHTTPCGGSEVKPLPAHVSTRRLYKKGFTSEPTPHNNDIFIAKGAFSRGHFSPQCFEPLTAGLKPRPFNARSNQKLPSGRGW